MKQIENCNTEIESLKTQCSELASEMSHKFSEISYCKSQLNETRQLVTTLVAEKNEAQQELVEQRQLNSLNRDEWEKAKAELVFDHEKIQGELSSQNEILKSEFEKQCRIISEYADKYEEYKKKFDDSNSNESEDLRNQIQALQNENETLKCKLDQEKDNSMNLLEDIQKLGENLNSITIQMEQKQAEFNALLAENEGFKIKMSESSNDNEIPSKSSDSNLAAEELIQLIQNLRNENQILQIQSTELGEQIRNLVAENKDLMRMFDAQQQKPDLKYNQEVYIEVHMESANGETHNRVDYSSNQIERLQAEKAKLEDELENQRLQIENLVNERDTLRDGFSNEVIDNSI